MGAVLSVCLGMGSMVQLGQNVALSHHLGHYLPASVVSYIEIQSIEIRIVQFEFESPHE